MKKDDGLVEEEYQSLIGISAQDEKTEVSDESNEVLQDERQDKELEKTRFTLKQILFLIFIGFFSFITFFFLLFPYNEVIKFYLNKIDKTRTLFIDFDNLDFSVLGNFDINKPVISIGSSQSKKRINVDLINLNVSPLKLYNNIFQTKMFMVSPKIVISDVLNFKFKTLSFSGNLNNFDKLQKLAFNQVSGNVNLKIKSGTLLFLSELPFLGKLDEIKHKDTKINLQFRKGKLFLKQFNILTSMGKIIITGNILIESSLGNSILDILVCPKLSEEFKNSRQDIDSMLLLFQNQTGNKCFSFGGTVANPIPKN